MRKWIAASLLVSACAHLREEVRLRAVPLEAPHVVHTTAGERLAVRGQRVGEHVQAQVTRQTLCVDVQEQRAEGFRRVERVSEGPSYTLEWVFGGLLTAGGAGLIAWTAASPGDPTSGPTGTTTNYGYGAAIGAVGLALLGGGLWDWHQIGVHEDSLGVQVLKKPGPETVCGEVPATAGDVRLTLPDGLQLEATLGATGTAVIALPEDLEARLTREGSRRATLEAKGDARAQVRIEL